MKLNVVSLQPHLCCASQAFQQSAHAFICTILLVTSMRPVSGVCKVMAIEVAELQTGCT